MIMDLILDRQENELQDGSDLYEPDGVGLLSPSGLYHYALVFGYVDLLLALERGTNEDVQEALCRYVDREGYSPEYKTYIRSKVWVL